MGGLGSEIGGHYCGTVTPDRVNGIKMDVSRETAEDQLQLLQS